MSDFTLYYSFSTPDKSTLNPLNSNFWSTKLYVHSFSVVPGNSGNVHLLRLLKWIKLCAMKAVITWNLMKETMLRNVSTADNSISCKIKLPGGNDSMCSLFPLWTKYFKAMIWNNSKQQIVTKVVASTESTRFHKSCHLLIAI